MGFVVYRVALGQILPRRYHSTSVLYPSSSTQMDEAWNHGAALDRVLSRVV
jgi:hypothetical protein